MTAKKGIFSIEEEKYLDASKKFGAIIVIKYGANTKINGLKISREHVIDIHENLLHWTFLCFERQISNMRP